MKTSSAFTSLVLVMAVSPAHFAVAFSQAHAKPRYVSSAPLKYRSLHHGPDVDPSSEIGSDSTKMDKEKIRHYAPGDFAHYVDPSDLFDGGDSEMGLAGDGNLGLRRIGRDVSPHMARTMTAKIDQAAEASSYAEELLNNSGMDVTRAQQLENWATQNEIALANRYTYLNDRTQDYHGHYTTEYEGNGEVSEEVVFISHAFTFVKYHV